MYFFSKMRWNLKGMSFDELWELEGKEAKAAAKSIEDGIVQHLYKAVAEEYVMSIGETNTAEDFDRYALGILPMREHLIFEQVIAVQEGFSIDVFPYLAKRREQMQNEPKFLYFVQMAWPSAERKLDEVWGQLTENLKAYTPAKVLALYRAAAQQKIMLIIDVKNADELNQLSQSPLLRMSEVETVWLLRDYIGFAEDVEKRYKFDS